MAHACNPSYSGGLQFEASPGVERERERERERSREREREREM
jgi:hypothetical protein